MRLLFFLGIVAFAAQASACRIVCSKGSTLWHLVAEGDSETFQVLEDSDVVTAGLTCHLLPATGIEAEKEEKRLVNLCTTEARGKKITFRTERIQQRRVKVTENGPTEELLEKLLWSWEEDGKLVRRVNLDRADCGSAEER